MDTRFNLDKSNRPKDDAERFESGKHLPQTRPLLDKEKEMIEKFLKERENERVSMDKL